MAACYTLYIQTTHERGRLEFAVFDDDGDRLGVWYGVREDIPAAVFRRVHTLICSNGSKWLGQRPDSIPVLLAAMDEHPLDRTFEAYGDFGYALDAEIAVDLPGKGWMQFSGNFATVSHVFGIRTRDKKTITNLVAAIKRNKRRDDYQAQPPFGRAALRELKSDSLDREGS